MSHNLTRMARLPATLKLALISTLLATCLGVVSGVVAATHLYSGFDYLVSLATLFGVSMRTPYSSQGLVSCRPAIVGFSPPQAIAASTAAKTTRK